MALSLTCSKINQSADGHIHVSFSDGSEIEFPSKPAALAWATPTDTLSDEASQVLKRLLMAWWIKQDPTGATPATVVGKTITCNLTVANIVTVG